MALRGRYRREHELRLVGVDERLAVQLQDPQLRVLEAFGCAVRSENRVLTPERGEFRAGCLQCVDEVGRARVTAVPRCSPPTRPTR
jgi:hypothetical protein